MPRGRTYTIRHQHNAKLSALCLRVRLTWQAAVRIPTTNSAFPTQAASTPATMSKQHCRMLQVERFFRQCRMLLRHCCSFWQQCCRFPQQCRTKFRIFDKVEANLTCSICFDFVERTKFRNRIVRHCSLLWLQSRMLLRHCCWCGRGFTCQTVTHPNRRRRCQFYHHHQLIFITHLWRWGSGNIASTNPVWFSQRTEN